MDNFNEYLIPEEALEKIKDPAVIKKMVEEGASFQEIIGYTEETMEKFYGAAYQLFQQKHFRDSSNAFVFLTIINPYVPNYWLGLGMSEQMVEEYESALVAYAMFILLDPKNPIPYFHAAKCLLAMNEQHKAIESLKLAVECAGEDVEHQELKTQALSYISTRDKSVDK